MKLAINFLLNCFLNFGNLSFWKIIGMTMDSELARFMAYLFLCYYENKWLLDAKKRDLRKALSNTFHFIDGLCAINNHLDFDRYFKNIYPSELQVKKKNISTSGASMLDIFKFKTQLRLMREMHFLFLLPVYHI